MVLDYEAATPDEELKDVEQKKAEFMKPIQKAMLLLTKHPKVEVVVDDRGHVISRRLRLESVEHSEGVSGLIAYIGPATDYEFHAGQPETKIVVIDQHNDGNFEDFPGTRLSQFGNGDFDMALGATLDGLDQGLCEGPSAYRNLIGLDIETHPDFSLVKIHHLSDVVDAALLTV